LRAALHQIPKETVANIVPINDRPIPVEEYRDLHNKHDELTKQLRELQDNLNLATNTIESLKQDKESVLQCLQIEKTKALANIKQSNETETLVVSESILLSKQLEVTEETLKKEKEFSSQLKQDKFELARKVAELTIVRRQEQEKFTTEISAVIANQAEAVDNVTNQLKELENSKNTIFNTVESSQRVLDKIIEIKNTFNMAEQLVPLSEKRIVFLQNVLNTQHDSLIQAYEDVYLAKCKLYDAKHLFKQAKVMGMQFDGQTTEMVNTPIKEATAEVKAAENNLNTVIKAITIPKTQLENLHKTVLKESADIQKAIQEFNQSTNTYIEECQKLIDNTDKRYTVEAYEDLLTKVNSLNVQLKQANDALVKQGVDNSKQIERMYKHYRTEEKTLKDKVTTLTVQCTKLTHETEVLQNKTQRLEDNLLTTLALIKTIANTGNYQHAIYDYKQRILQHKTELETELIANQREGINTRHIQEELYVVQMILNHTGVVSGALQGLNVTKSPEETRLTLRTMATSTNLTNQANVNTNNTTSSSRTLRPMATSPNITNKVTNIQQGPARQWNKLADMSSIKPTTTTRKSNLPAPEQVQVNQISKAVTDPLELPSVPTTTLSTRVDSLELD
jgi:chromosome segregation ATPase